MFGRWRCMGECGGVWVVVARPWVVVTAAAGDASANSASDCPTLLLLGGSCGGTELSTCPAISLRALCCVMGLALALITMPGVCSGDLFKAREPPASPVGAAGPAPGVKAAAQPGVAAPEEAIGDGAGGVPWLPTPNALPDRAVV